MKGGNTCSDGEAIIVSAENCQRAAQQLYDEGLITFNNGAANEESSLSSPAWGGSQDIWSTCTKCVHRIETHNPERPAGCYWAHNWIYYNPPVVDSKYDVGVGTASSERRPICMEASGYQLKAKVSYSCNCI